MPAPVQTINNFIKDYKTRFIEGDYFTSDIDELVFCKLSFDNNALIHVNSAYTDFIREMVKKFKNDNISFDLACSHIEEVKFSIYLYSLRTY